MLFTILNVFHCFGIYGKARLMHGWVFARVYSLNFRTDLDEDIDVENSLEELIDNLLLFIFLIYTGES